MRKEVKTSDVIWQAIQAGKCQVEVAKIFKQITGRKMEEYNTVTEREYEAIKAKLIKT